MGFAKAHGLVSSCLKRGNSKHPEKEFESLKVKINYMIDTRNAIKDDLLKDVMLGKMPTRECRAWLDKAAQIETHARPMLNELNIFRLHGSLQEDLHEPLMKILNEIDDHLNNSPFEHAMEKQNMAEIGQRLTKMHQSVKLAKRVDLGRSKMWKAEERIGHTAPCSVAPPASETEQRKHMQHMQLEVKVNTSLEELVPETQQERFEKGMLAVQLRSKMAPQATTGVELEESAELLISLSDDGRDPMEIDLDPTSVQTTEGMQADSAEPKREPSVHVTEIESIPSDTDGEDERKPEPRMSLKSIGLITQVAGPSNRPEVGHIKLRLSLSMKNEISTVYDVNTEVPVGQAIPVQEFLERKPNARRSIERNVQNVLACLKHVSVNRIGIFGTGGVGKTSVLKALRNHPEIKHMFDSIIWITVSRHSSPSKIKNEFERQLLASGAGLSIDGRVGVKTSEALQSLKVLLLLDDVWHQIDLEAVGIPKSGPECGCTIILTTRSLDVCHGMAVDKEVAVEILSREEAWSLFCDQVGRIIDDLDIKPLAQVIVDECGGLPLAIIIVGRALRNEKSVLVWKHAVREISLPSEHELAAYDTKAVIWRLRFSYDRLTHEMKNCFLYCALFPEDYEVNVSDLIEGYIRESLIEGNTLAAQKKGNHIIRALIDSSLLENGDNESSIKMHDMVRDLALWIIMPEEEGCQFLVGYDLRSSRRSLEFPERIKLLEADSHRFLLRAGAGLVEPPSNEDWQFSKMIFLMDNELSTLPEIPLCRNLLALFLQRNYRLRSLPPSLFECMPSLQVVNLSKTKIKTLPSSMFRLKNLQVLILRDCEHLFTLPPEIEGLEHLKLLDLHGTKISSLPDQIGKLRSLNHLRVSLYGPINHSEYVMLPVKLVSDGIVSRFRELKELSIVVDPGDQRWKKCVRSVMEGACSLPELAALCLYFPELELLEHFIQKSEAWKGNGLAKFNFVVGHDVKRVLPRVPLNVEGEHAQHIRCLRFVNDGSIPDAVGKVLARTTAFYLDHHLKAHSLSDFGGNNLDQLKFCILRECPEIQVLIDFEITRSLLSLEYLGSFYLWNLMRIWKGPAPPGSLSGLKVLVVHACPRLTCILTISMLSILPNLEELAVEDCPAIEVIISEDAETSTSTNWLPRLKKLTLHYLPKLSCIWKGSWPPIEQMSFYHCPSLRSLGMHHVLDTIVEIKAEKEWWDKLEWVDTTIYLKLKEHLVLIHGDEDKS
ncbi:NB-ARC [Dillenia turbinata]|uniref:NB-ARC n=1 Tax=Dillenia turbinata TaxID=194707 RepID=A0AAN8V8U2_9MAGN